MATSRKEHIQGAFACVTWSFIKEALYGTPYFQNRNTVLFYEKINALH